jgi:hypothetical protein
LPKLRRIVTAPGRRVCTAPTAFRLVTTWLELTVVQLVQLLVALVAGGLGLPLPGELALVGGGYAISDALCARARRRASRLGAAAVGSAAVTLWISVGVRLGPDLERAHAVVSDGRTALLVVAAGAAAVYWVVEQLRGRRRVARS